MRKSLSILFFSIISAMMALAGPVSRQQALTIASDYLQHSRTTRGVSQPSRLTLAYECLPKSARSVGVNSPLYYVFNHGEKEGFLVVSGDDRMTPVLGFVESGTFAKQQINDGLRWWLSAMEETMLSVVKSKSEMRVYADKAVEKGLKDYVEPMVQVNWGQSSPYNDRCPVDNVHGGQHAVAGCSAVAMAQVLSKWKYPERGEGFVQYTTYTDRINVREDLSTFTFDWSKILPSYAGNLGSKSERAAVAELVYACGVAIRMDYCANASGAFVYADHFEDHFGIDPACNDIERVYFTRSEWDALIKKELSEGRPVVYNGFSLSAGHAFVCDGYNEDGLFHINWGWDGSMNGYYALAELNSAVEHAGAPTDAEGSFNLDQSVIYGIQPKVGEGNQPHYQLCYVSVAPSRNATRSKVGLVISDLRADGNGFRGSLSVGIYDKENRYVGHIKAVRNLSMNSGKTFRTYNLTGELPEGLADGVYTICPVCQGEGQTEFEPLRGRKGSPYVNSLTMTVEGDAVKLELPEVIDAKLKIVGAKLLGDKCYAGAPNAFELKVRNDGAMYNGPILLFRQEGDREVRIYDNNYIIESGEEISMRVKYVSSEGVDHEKIVMKMAAKDDDIVYNNGFVYRTIGTFEYDMLIPASGKPSFQVKKCHIKNKTAYLGEPLDIDVVLSNKGGFYGGDVFAFAFPEGGGSGIIYGKRQIAIDKDETLSFNLSLPTETLHPGNYFIQLFSIDESNQYAFISQARYDFSVKDRGTLSISNTEGFNVLGVKHAFVVPEKVQCGVVTAVDDNQLHIDYRYQSGTIVPANTPVVVKASGRVSVPYQVVVSTVRRPVDNLLKMTVSEDGFTNAGEGDYWYYEFGDNGEREKYGFYLSSPDGSPFKLRIKQCYLALPANQGYAAQYVFAEALTGIDQVTEDMKGSVTIYSLSGVRIYTKFSDLPKGIYIVNGKKVIK